MSFKFCLFIHLKVQQGVSILVTHPVLYRYRQYNTLNKNYRVTMYRKLDYGLMRVDKRIYKTINISSSQNRFSGILFISKTGIKPDMICKREVV